MLCVFLQKHVCDVCWKNDLSCALHRAAEGNGKGHRWHLYQASPYLLGGKKQSWSEGGQWLRKAKSRMKGYKLSVHKYSRIESHGWLHTMTWPHRNVFFFWISIWMQYLSSHPWPCLIPLLCSASQMHSDQERWKQECARTHVRTHVNKHTHMQTHTGTGLRALVKSDRFSFFLFAITHLHDSMSPAMLWKNPTSRLSFR